MSWWRRQHNGKKKQCLRKQAGLIASQYVSILTKIAPNSIAGLLTLSASVIQVLCTVLCDYDPWRTSSNLITSKSVSDICIEVCLFHKKHFETSEEIKTLNQVVLKSNYVFIKLEMCASSNCKKGHTVIPSKWSPFIVRVKSTVSISMPFLPVNIEHCTSFYPKWASLYSLVIGSCCIFLILPFMTLNLVLTFVSWFNTV